MNIWQGSIHTRENLGKQKIKFSIKDSFSTFDQICSFLRIGPYLLENSLMENFIFVQY